MRKLTKILHVEDDRDIMEVSRVALEGLNGFRMVACYHWRDAVRLALRFKPDLFLLDVMMPEKSGLETLAELRRLPEFRSTPAIFLTAKVQEYEIQSFLATGAIGVITKPFDPATLGDLVCELWVRAEAGQIETVGTG